MNKKHYLAKTYNSLGNVHLYLQDYDSSRIYYKKALEISEKVNSLERERIYYINNLGEIAFRRDQYDTAKSLYLQALQECESLQDTSKMSWLLNNIGDVFLAVQNYHEAIDYYKRSLEVEKGQNISSEYERAIKNISAAYDSLGNFKTASEYKNKYVQHLEKTSNTKEKLIHRNSQYLEAQSKWAIKEYMLLTLCCLFLIVLSCIVIGIVHHRKQTNS